MFTCVVCLCRLLDEGSLRNEELQDAEALENVKDKQLSDCPCLQQDPSVCAQKSRHPVQTCNPGTSCKLCVFWEETPRDSFNSSSNASLFMSHNQYFHEFTSSVSVMRQLLWELLVRSAGALFPLPSFRQSARWRPFLPNLQGLGPSQIKLLNQTLHLQLALIRRLD